jgi:hypothetical protein
MALSSSTFHSCAAIADGTAKCWGADGSGQLGDASSASSRIETVAGLRR